MVLALAWASPASAANGSSATFSKVSSWSTGYEGKYTIKNASTAKLTWTIEFDVPTGGQITSSWDAKITKTGNHVVATGVTWNATVAAGATVSFGWIAANGSGEPTNCKLNGLPCTAAIVPTSTTTSPAPSPSPTASATPSPSPTTSPTTTAPPTTPPAPSPTTTMPANGATATFSTVTSWSTGYEGKYTIKNASTAKLTWTIEFDVPNGGQISSFWDAKIIKTGNHVVATGVTWNATVAAGATVSFGWVAANGNAAPANCKINGQPCTGGGTTPTTSPSPTTSPTPTSTTTAPPAPGTLQWYLAQIPKFAAAPAPQRVTIDPNAMTARIPTTNKVVFLTIDDGWYQSDLVRDVIVESHLPFTAFVTSEYIEDSAGKTFFQYLRSHGVSLQNHTLNHPDLVTLTKAQQQTQFCTAQSAITSAFGTAPYMYRAPFLSYNADTITAAHACGPKYGMAGNLSYYDGITPDEGYELQAGDIVILHFDPEFPDSLLAVLQNVARNGLIPARLDDYIA